MAKLSHPRKGSLAFSPRVRARKQYFTARSWKDAGKKLMGFAGYKAGMTHVYAVDKRKTSPSFEQEIVIPATIIECPPLAVMGVRAYKQTIAGLRCIGQENAEKPAKNLGRRIHLAKKAGSKPIDSASASEIRLIVHTQPTFKKTPEIFEVPVAGKVDEAYNYAKSVLGKELTVSEVFEPGMLVDVTGVTTGRGIEGPVRRWGARVEWRKSTGKRRHVGSINPWTPTRVMWTALLAGQRGYHRRTEFNKMVLKVGAEGKEVSPRGGMPHYGIITKNYILVKGSVPGPKKRALMIRSGVRQPTGEKFTPVLTGVYTESQQGRARY